jgi:hypothetical protein
MNKDILKEFNFSAAEEKFINGSETANTADMNCSRVISTLILTKQLKQSTEQLLESNRLIIEAENKNSKKMQYLTWALIAVGAIQAISMLINLLFRYCIR